MQQTQNIKKAFSLLEVIFVIVILGIVASIGSSVIVKVYESYIMQRSIHNASIKTELAINQLANRLVYRINTSVVARRPGQLGNASPGDIIPLNQVGPANANTHTILEWIGYDNDGFTTQNPPVWNGFTDLDASDFNQVTSTGSILNNEIALLNNLFPNLVSPALIFSGLDYRQDNLTGTIFSYSANCMYNTAGNGCIFPVNLLGVNLTFAGGGNRNAGDMIYTEFYKLAASAYAVVPNNAHQVTQDGANVWDLNLHFDYQPWENENYLSNQNNQSTLLRNVSVFRFTQEQNSVRLKICVIEAIGINTEISICKEKAVIR